MFGQFVALLMSARKEQVTTGNGVATVARVVDKYIRGCYSSTKVNFHERREMAVPALPQQGGDS